MRLSKLSNSQIIVLRHPQIIAKYEGSITGLVLLSQIDPNKVDGMSHYYLAASHFCN